MALLVAPPEFEYLPGLFLHDLARGRVLDRLAGRFELEAAVGETAAETAARLKAGLSLIHI